MKRGKRLLRLLLLLALLGLAAWLLLQKSLSGVILDTAYARAYALTVDTLNGAVRQSVSAGVAYEELVTVRTDDSGRVTMLQANTARMNALAADIASQAQQALAEDAARHIRVPLGAVTVSFHSEFETAGINQTRHKIYLLLHAAVQLVLPANARPVAVDSQLLIAESIIVGQVPGSYTNVPESEMLNFAD